MTVATPNKELQKAQRNQAFENKPANASGQCPLKALEIAIYPVRYAIDESPARGRAQGPNPLPKGWSSVHLPDLKTRSYTLRQLRDGWLYVWDETDKTFHEYQVQGHQFTRHQWGSTQLNKDERNNPGETKPYLLYPRRSRLLICYSPVQWTWRLCEKMRSNPQELKCWMRALNLQQYCDQIQAAHAAPLRDLGSAVADVLAGGPPPTFKTCLVASQFGDDISRPCKPSIDQALILGSVPDQDSALFVALDDPLANVDDLALNLQGRRLELIAAEEEHRNKITSAALVQDLCGVRLEPFMPHSIASDTSRKLAFIKDAHELLEAEAQLRHHSGSDTMLSIKSLSVQRVRGQFKKSWGSPPSGTKWQAMVEQWHQKSTWREDVEFDKAWAYLQERNDELERLNAHIQRSEHDLIAWLQRLSPKAEDISYDPCHPRQATELLETMASLYGQLAGSEKGKALLCKQYGRPTTLVGLALFNFNTELSELIDKVSANFTAHGTIDNQGRQGDGSGKAHGGLSDTTSGISRANELKSVLDLASVQSSALYQSISEPAKRALETLRDVVGGKAKNSWNLIAFTLLPALSERFAPKTRIFTYSAMQVLVSTEISTQTRLVLDSDFAKKNHRWQTEVASLERNIKGLQRTLTLPGKGPDKRSARIQLASLEQKREVLNLQKPNQVVGAIAAETRITTVQARQVNAWLATLGQSELLDQLQLKAKSATGYATRSRQWINQELGGSLPVLVAGLNVWNFLNSLDKAKGDGVLSADELRTVGANAAYTANALMAIWVVPAWNKWATLERALGNNTTQLARAGVRAWLKAGEAEASLLARKLVLRTMGMTAFGAIAAGVEAWQVSKDIDKSTGTDELYALRAKQITLGLMSTVAGVQLIGSALGFWFGFAWVMSNPITIIIALLGVIYLISSMIANQYKREGLRLWLYRCSWGKSPSWTHSDDDHKDELRTLSEICLRPSLVAKATSLPYYDRGPRIYTGFWLQLLLPSELSGTVVRLQPAMVDSGWFSDGLMRGIEEGFYNQFLEGHWVPPEQFGQPPTQRPNGTLPGDVSYESQTQQRLWQTWIAYQRQPMLELEIQYPEPVLASGNGRGYMFRLDIDSFSGEADLKSNAFSKEPNIDMVLSSKSTRFLDLYIPSSGNDSYE
ncbi:T6SS effector BTH_I2691 family protein [Pseudomonas matsuisoli]|uniref:Toxin VasX N-terminal region domain-containing protein n=1 Tax=Pseudomonas matsuisoli TaxID=1515666 RepID=A0A917PKH8_9PSED|nr:T6SS effector BTH_I2691 family protein [Pseudomonas matsuisoli]GGJ82911.1 hypothetical protein GCM10009304_06170 [Pseudomonas matsuisoli]